MKPRHGIICFLTFFFAFMLIPATQADQNDAEIIQSFDTLRAIDDPDLRVTSMEDGAYIPANYLYPLVEWTKAKKDNGIYLLKISSKAHELNIIARTNQWQPDGEQFKPFLKEREFRISLFSKNENKTYAGKPVRVMVADQPLEDRIIYRLVEPLFNINQTSSVETFNWDSKEKKELFSIPGTCIGCHAYGKQQALFNVKKVKDRRWVSAAKNEQGYRYQQQVIGEFSFLALSPDNRFAALVLNAKGSINIKKDYIEPFDLPYQSGDIFIYDFEGKTLKPLNGASELDFVEDMPCFSADGKFVFFTRYRYDATGIKAMDLYKVPFNQGEGGSAVPVQNAVLNGQYHYFAKCSPNGKWLSFCKGNGQQSMFARKSSDIYLLSTDKKKLLKLKCNKADIMDSWHWWSADSRWLIFVSNREDNRLTSLYLTHIDEQGNDTPPVKLAGYDQVKINLPQFIPTGAAAVGPDFMEFLKGVFEKP